MATIYSTDIKSPADLCRHFTTFGLEQTRSEVERVRNDARQFDGTPGPASPEGEWSEVGIGDFLGSCRTF